MANSSIDRLVVVGTSAGGVSALMGLVHALPVDFQAPLLITLHIGVHESVLPQLLSQVCDRDVAHAVAGESIKRGTIRIAPSDHHMTVGNGVLEVTRGPKENYARPAIDPLFRSAALAYGAGVIGVILTGRLDDGTAGLQEIKRRGGITVVQDPSDAQEPSMPRSAIEHLDVDHVVPLETMPMLLTALAAKPLAQPTPTPMPDTARAEMNVSLRRGDPMHELQQIAKPSTYSCPECHGVLWRILDSQPQRYRCHTGHAYSARVLQAAMLESSDQAGWAALRALQERMFLIRQMAALAREGNRDTEADRLDESRKRIERQIDLMSHVLHEGPDPIE